MAMQINTSMTTRMTAKELMCKRKNQLDDDRETYRTHWREIKENMIPDHGFYLTGNTDQEVSDGEKVRQDILDDTAEKAIQIMASGIQSGFTNPARPWFRVGLADKDLQEFHAAKLWLDEVTRIILGLFSRTLYNSTYHTYMELGAFGTGGFMILDDPVETMRCRPLTIGEYSIALNSSLKVDTLVRDFWMPAKQLVEQFGIDNVSTMARQAYEQGNYLNRFRVVNFIEPNDDQIKGLLARIGRDGRMVPAAFRSVYMEVANDDTKSDQFLSVQPYNMFPAAIPRWHVIANKAYGVSPGMVELSNIKMLYKLQEMKMEAIDKVNSPPLVSDSDSHFVNPLPDGISYLADASGIKDRLAPLYQVNPDLTSVMADIQDTRDAIRSGFYNNLFLMIAQSDGDMTATEVLIREEEKMVMIGPVIERLNPELGDVTVERGFDLGVNADIFPPPPPEIAGADIDIEYVGLLAQAAKAVNQRKVQEYVGFAGQLATLKPEVLDNIDADQMLKSYGEEIGVPANVTKSPEAVFAEREQREQQIQAQQAAEAAMNAAQGAETLSKAKLDQNSVLDAVTGRQQSGVPTQ